jgi:sugar lactone lactonase YvrE
MKKRLSVLLHLSLALLSGTAGALGQVSILTGGGDISRTNANTHETVLSPVSVSSGNFQQLYSSAVNGRVQAQPLYVADVKIRNSISNVVVLATTSDDVYALDADTGVQLWHITLLDVAHGAGPDAAYFPVPEGIPGTPVVDPATGTIYLVGATWENNYMVQRLHALDISSGDEKFGGPATIRATVSGTGNGSSGGQLSLDPGTVRNRAGLLLLNGIVYIAFLAFPENGPGWHGWVLAYDDATLSQTGAWTTTPDGAGSGIWMSGAALAADVTDPVSHPFGRMFIATGNGSFNAVPPFGEYRNFGDDIVRLDLTGGIPAPQDSFTANNQQALSSADLDLGSGGVLILPDSVGSAQHPHLLVQAGKSGNIFLVDRDNMGGFAATDMIVEELDGGLAYQGMYGSPAYWNGKLFFLASNDFLKSFSIAQGLLSSSPTSISTTPASHSYSTPSISANGDEDGIVWTLTGTEETAATLRAYDATNLTSLLFSSDTNPNRDQPGLRTKFSVPTVVNGKVYVGSDNRVSVFGSLFAVSPSSPIVQSTLGASGTTVISVASSVGSSFSGSVTLSAKGLPNGVSANFSDPVIALGQSPSTGLSVLNLSVANSVPLGSYQFQVTGESGSLQSVVTLTLAVGVGANVTFSNPIASFSSQMGSTSASQPITLNNTGTAELAISNISINGTNANDFADTTTCGSALPAGASCTVLVTFSPQKGVERAALTITDNAGAVSGSSQTIALVGHGLGPSVSITPSLFFNYPNFGPANAGLPVSLLNTGTAPLLISAVSIGGPNASDFATTASTCGASVAAGASCVIDVSFTPSVQGPENATLSVTDNAGDVSGAVQTVALSDAGSRPVAVLSTAALNFELQLEGVSATQTINITNTGSSPLLINGTAISGPNSPDFSTTTTTCGGSLAPRVNCTVSVSFDPTTSNAESAVLAITDNSGGVASSTQTVTLSGIGATAQTSAFLTGSPAVTAKLRNNYPGFLGMQIAVGSTPVIVSQLGRWVVPGNHQTHIVKLVTASTGIDVAGGSVSLRLSGATSGQYAYVALTSPITLLANTSYYVVSQEFVGGDAWYDISQVASSPAAAVSGGVYQNGSDYVSGSGNNLSYVPANFLFTLGSRTAPPAVAITAPAAGNVSGIITLMAAATAPPGLDISGVQFQLNGTNLGPVLSNPPYQTNLDTTQLLDGQSTLTAVAVDSSGNAAVSTGVPVMVDNATQVLPFLTGSPGPVAPLRNNYGGFVGMQVTVGNTPLFVSQLGRWVVPGNHQAHIVKLVTANTAADVAGGSVSLNLSGATSGQYAYAALASPVMLQASTSYDLVSQEFVGGDAWYEANLAVNNPASSLDGAVYQSGASFVLTDSPHQSFVPPNFLFTLSPMSASSRVAITAPAGGTLSGVVTLMAAATPAFNLTITSVQFQLNGNNLGPALRNAPYSTALDTTQLLNGPYALTAVATDSSGNTVTSAGVTVTVNNSPGSADFGSVNVCAPGQTAPSPCSQTLALNYTVPVTGTLGTPIVLTDGVAGLDYTLASGNTCTGSVVEGSLCTANVMFVPLFAGLRRGVVQIIDGSGNVLASTFIHGTGLGPQIAFGPGAQVQLGSGLNKPAALVTNAAGDVFIADTGSSQVIKMPAGGGAQTVLAAGLGANGLAVNPAGDVFIADSVNNRVVKLLAGGGARTTVGTGLNNPGGLAVDGAGDVFIVDAGNGRIVKVSANEDTQITVADGMASPQGVAVDAAGDVFISDSGNNRVLEIAAGGNAQITVANGLASPQGLAVDAAGDVFIADSGNNRVLEMPADGSAPFTVGTGLSSPSGVTLDAAGDVFIADSNNHQVVELERSQSPTLTFAATPIGGISSDSPRSLTIANIGNATLTVTGLTISPNFGQIPGSGTPLDCTASSPLAAGASCSLGINFVPAGAGTLSGSVTLTDNALNANPAVQVVNLGGAGTTSQQSQSISFTNPGGRTVNTTLVLSALASSGLPVTFNSDTPAVCTVLSGVASFVATGTCSITASQPGNATYTAATPVTLSFSVSSGAAAPTAFLIGQPAAALRNNYSGFVGMEVVVGSAPLVVSQLGRWVVAGNSQTHVVKLVNASTGIDLTGGSVTLNLSGATAAQYAYAPLASAITLAANTSYYVVTQEVSGRDQWYDGGLVTVSGSGTVNGAVYQPVNGSYRVSGSVSVSYGPVNFLFSLGVASQPTVSITAPSNGATVSGTIPLIATAVAGSGLSIASVQFKLNGNNLGAPLLSAPYSTTLDTSTLLNTSASLTAVGTDSTGISATSSAVTFNVNNAAAPTAFLIGQPAAALRNNYSGFVGMEVVVGSAPLVVSQLGRWVVAGNSQTHVVKLVNASTGIDLTGGSVTLNLSGATAAQYAYAPLASAITLAANTSYYVVTQEVSGRDQWYDGGLVTVSGSGTVNGAVYQPVNGSYRVSGSVSVSYGPVNFLFSLGVASQPTVSITAPSNGATVSGTIPLIATAVAGSGLSIASVQFKLNGNNLGAPLLSAPYSTTLDTSTLLNTSASLDRLAKNREHKKLWGAYATASIRRKFLCHFRKSCSSVPLMTPTCTLRNG